MQYRPNLGYVYPEQSDEHMIKVKHLRDTNFDENHKYYNPTFCHKLKRVLLVICLYTFGYFAATIRYGLKIHGRKQFKKNKKKYTKINPKEVL